MVTEGSNPAKESSKDQLKFQEFDFSNPINPQSQQDTSGFGLGTKPTWSNLNFYAKYFEVSTEDVKERLMLALRADASFLERLAGRLDFYGPIWIAISAGALLFVISSANKTIWSHRGEFIDFPLLTMGIVEILIFTAFQTAFSWGFFRWRSVDGVKLGEMAALSGYSLTPLVPAFLACTVPLSIVQWAAVMGAVAISCTFIKRNLWPILRTSPTIRQEQATFFIIGLLAVQSIFILSLRVMFFRHVHIPLS